MNVASSSRPALYSFVVPLCEPSVAAPAAAKGLPVSTPPAVALHAPSSPSLGTPQPLASPGGANATALPASPPPNPTSAPAPAAAAKASSPSSSSRSGGDGTRGAPRARARGPGPPERAMAGGSAPVRFSGGAPPDWWRSAG